MQHQSCLEPKPILKTREGDEGGQEFMRDQGRSHDFSKGRVGSNRDQKREYSLFRDLNIVGYLLQKGLKGGSRASQDPLAKLLVTCDSEGYNTKSEFH